ncbi:hypothetical protein NY78_1335 [Desulfovibrio sp. TomC]|nr:hypothetical protein NY78_1335 [Desulfovibrio sp. TomC]
MSSCPTQPAGSFGRNCLLTVSAKLVTSCKTCVTIKLTAFVKIVTFFFHFVINETRRPR